MIRLDKKYIIDADNYSYSLKEYMGLNKDNKPIYKAVAYHGQIADCVKSYYLLVQRELVANNDLTLVQVLNNLDKFNKQISKLLEKISSKEDHNE